MIYFAPLQGFTDYVIRKNYAHFFNKVDVFFTLFISVKNNQILKKYIKEVLPEKNSQKQVIPQVLAENINELLICAKFLGNMGYREINLNLGCPYPMVTNRGQGAGLLPHPEKIYRMLADFYEKNTLKLSVKMRAGLYSPEEIFKVIPILNKFPLTEIILHPRVASQLYRGEILDTVFQRVSNEVTHRLVFNGDIFSVSDFQKRKNQFASTQNWMLGRGILMNVFLPAEIAGEKILPEKKRLILAGYHQSIFNDYMHFMDNPGNVLTKMKQFWIYFSYHFPNQKKAFKKIKKAGNYVDYENSIQEIFSSLV